VLLLFYSGECGARDTQALRSDNDLPTWQLSCRSAHAMALSSLRRVHNRTW